MLWLIIVIEKENLEMKMYFSVVSKKTKMKCVGVIVLAFISSFLASIWPVKLGELYTKISNGEVGTIKQGILLIAAFGIIYLLAECIAIVRRVLLDCIIAVHEAEVREKSIERLLKMPVSYYSGCLSGEKTAQLNQGVSGFSQLIKITCNDVFATVLIAICTLGQVFLNAPGIIVGIMFAYLVLTIIISAFQIRSQNGIREKIVDQKNVLDGQICQSISNLELIRSMGAEEYEKNRLCPDILNISGTEKKHHSYMGAFDCLKQFCKIIFQVVLLILSVILVLNGKMSSGSVITICLLFQQLIKPIDEVYRFMDETASSVIKARALLEVTSSATDRIFEITSSKDWMSSNDIHLENVLITNPEKEKALAWYEDILIPCGKRVALQGANGCGKTTLVRCLNRYYPYMHGKITLFGKDQENYSQKELTELLYYSPQISYFFSGTIRENLIYGLDRKVDDNELITALSKVYLVGNYKGVICENPEKALNFKIGEKGDELSGGMKQRLSLARAFLRHPKVYIFDEITANLDASATESVLTNIEKYAKTVGAGIIYISHDKKVIDRCDEIIEVTNKIAEYVTLNEKKFERTSNSFSFRNRRQNRLQPLIS